MHSNKKNKEAIDWYTKAIAKAPEEGIVYYNRGLIYNNTKDKSLACADLRKALSLSVTEAKQVIDDICK